VLDRIDAHGDAVVVDVTREGAPDRGSPARHRVAEPAHVTHGMRAGLHRDVHRGAAIGRLGEVGGLAEFVGERREDRFGEPGECGRRGEVARDSQHLGSRNP
jgi:hypothetical protein